MHINLPSRREFIRNSSMAASLLLLLGTGGCESILDQIKNRPIRRRINPSSTDSLADLQVYKDAILQMKSLPSSDKRSWWAQARIHGNLADPPICANAGTYNFNLCQHGHWFFLPWHRAYLGHLEQICRKLTGVKQFGLPYWNWGLNRSVPSVFWGNNSNALFESCRGVGPGDTLPAGIYSTSTLDSIMNEPNFLVFGSGYPSSDPRIPKGQGQLESNHGSVHGFTGGFMGAGGSAFDPIFYTHHCMIDYMWYEWNVNKGFDNPSDPLWFDHKWTNHFVNGDGDPVETQVGLTVLWPVFSYQYEPSQIGSFNAKDVLVQKSKKDIEDLKKRLEKGAAIELKTKKTIPFSRGEILFAKRSLTRQTEISISEFISLVKDESKDKVLLNIGFADFPPSNDFFVRVFINMPEANADTPPDDIHYAGSFSFFGATGTKAHNEHNHKPLYLVDLSPTLVKMRKAGILSEKEKLTIQLVTIPVAPNKVIGEEMLTLEEISILVGETNVVQKK